MIRFAGSHGPGQAGDGHRSSSIYGPVHSWRFGRSLGIDPLLIDSICSFDCVYCQLGRINDQTDDRSVFVPTERVREDLLAAGWDGIDVITVSGSGEPTLASNLGELIRLASDTTKKPVVVLTNASMFHDASVRADLAAADHVSCKLDAVRERQFQTINRPLAGITLADVIEGIRQFRREYRGVLSIQLMLLPATLADASGFAAILRDLAPDEVFVNVPSRESPPSWSLSSRGAHQEFDHRRAMRLLDGEIVSDFSAQLRDRSGLPVVTAPVAGFEEVRR